MNQTETKRIIEALLFATDSPIPISRLKDIIGTATPAETKKTLEEISNEYESTNRSFFIQEVAGGYQIRTKPEYQSWLVKLKKSREEGKLSTAALETLSIIAYKQPVIRAEIESIRGVDSSAIIRALMDKGLVRIAGRADSLGHPIIYGTTPKFLEKLGLGSVKDLPRPTELR